MKKIIFIDDEKNSVYNGVNLVNISTQEIGVFTTIWYDLKCIIQATLDNRYDVIYMLGYGTSVFCFIPKLFGKVVCINMDGLEWKRSKWSKIAKIYFRFMEYLSTITANYLIADSSEIQQYLVHKYRIQKKVFYLSYGAKLFDRDKLNSNNNFNLTEKSYYLVVSRLEPENMIIEILKGFTHSESNKKLVIVGNIDIKNPYIELLLKYKAYKQITFLGGVYDKSLLYELRINAFCYIHGHSVGVTNPSLLEAMASKSIVLAHDNVFNKEVCGEFAYYFSNSVDISRKLNDIEKNTHKNIFYSEKLYHRFLENYTWDKIVTDYEAFFQLILDKHKSG